MSPDNPCKLPAKDLASRMAWIRREILPLALRRVPHPEDVVFEFPAGRTDNSHSYSTIADRVRYTGALSFRASGYSPPKNLALGVVYCFIALFSDPFSHSKLKGAPFRKETKP